MEISLEDVMKMACKAYHDELKQGSFYEKGIKGKLFLNIIKKLFDSFGGILGYDDFSTFFSDIIKLKNEKKKQNVNCCLTKKPVEIFMRENQNEGGLYFYTLNQIREFDLNPDSYF